MKRSLIATLIGAIALSACGGGGGAVSDEAQAALEPLVIQLRAAAGARDAGAMTAQLGEIRRQVTALTSNGKLSEAAAMEILAGAAAVEQNTALVTTTTTRPPRSTQPVTEAPAEKQDKKRGGGDSSERRDGDGNDD